MLKILRNWHTFCSSICSFILIDLWMKRSFMVLSLELMAKNKQREKTLSHSRLGYFNAKIKSLTCLKVQKYNLKLLPCSLLIKQWLVLHPNFQIKYYPWTSGWPGCIASWHFWQVFPIRNFKKHHWKISKRCPIFQSSKPAVG